MTPEEFEVYLAWVVDDYADELERNGRAYGEAARARSVQSFAELLPRGLDTPEHVVLVAEAADDGHRVGHIWFAPSDEVPERAWIYDVTVEESERGKGYGRALMRAFELRAREHGFVQAGLNVFGDNLVARTLYESLGYREISRQMAKDL
jgi:GNAT superfamily N-acetyltransferase